MCEIRRKALPQYILARVAKGRMTKVVPKRNRLCQILIEKECARHCPRYLRYLERVCKPCSVVVVLRAKKHLRFMHKPAESLAVRYSVAVALKLRANEARLYGEIPSLRFGRKRSKGRKSFSFPFVHKLCCGHKRTSFRHNLHVFYKHTILYEGKLKNPFYFLKFF
jgi:hypothetical protein